MIFNESAVVIDAPIVIKRPTIKSTALTKKAKILKSIWEFLR